MGFSFQITLRVFFLLGTSLLLAVVWAMPGLYLTFFCLVVLLLLQLWALLYQVNRTNRELTRFLDAIAYDDFSQSFSFNRPDKSFRGLSQALNRVIRQFRQVRLEKEKSAQFLQVVLQQIPVAVLVVDTNGKVIVINAAAKQLLGVNRLTALVEIGAVDQRLLEALNDLGREGKKMVEATVGGVVQQLAISWTEFVTDAGRQTIITMQNIRIELDRREVRAWQDLIRILSHEIMNSLTPIASLSRSAGGLLQPAVENPRAADPQTLADVDQALETIARRSEGLLNFVDSYRTLARLPTPKPEYLRVDALLERTLTLMQPDQKEVTISISKSVNPTGLTIFADPELLSQALINLVKNARDAVAGRPDARIALDARQDSLGTVLLEVIDNGGGIQEEDREKIWIPFFSTKKAGTGIGLSLTRQIVTLHGGSIQAHSKPAQGTRIVIPLPAG